MKRITILTCLTLSLAVSTVSAATLPVVPSPVKVEKKLGEIINIGSIVISRIASDGQSGYAKVISSGEEVYFINPTFLPLSIGQTVTAEVYCESIIDPPRRTKKKVGGMIGIDNAPDTDEHVGPPYLAIVIGL